MRIKRHGVVLSEPLGRGGGDHYLLLGSPGASRKILKLRF